VAYPLDQRRAGPLAQGADQFVPARPVITPHLDLDQFVMSQGAVQLGDDRGAGAGGAEDHYGLEGVAEASEVLFLAGAELHYSGSGKGARILARPDGPEPGRRRKMARRTKSSKRWIAEHESDEFVKRARQAGWRSRAVFKLEEIQARDHVIRPGMTVVDLGAAPGAWCQYVMHVMGGKGELFALDILPMDPVAGVICIQGDFRDENVLQELEAALGSRKVDLVLSDMAPNISGMTAVDQPRAMYLAELALDFARRHLAVGGSFVAKVFQGEGFQEFIAELRRSFETVRTRKPEASRSRSREVYSVARNYRL